MTALTLESNQVLLVTSNELICSFIISFIHSFIHLFMLSFQLIQFREYAHLPLNLEFSNPQ